MDTSELSPDLNIGVTFDSFHWSGTVPSSRERLNRVVRAGEIASAVPRSITLEIPSGPLAVLTLCDERSLRTSSWEQVTLDSTGFGWVRCEELGTGFDLVKHEVKKLLNKFAFSVGEFASVPW